MQARGPISCGIDAEPILKYTGGIFKKAGSMSQDHVISVVGWGSATEADAVSGVEAGEQYWIVRNSWGEFWGEMGYIRVAMGSLAMEQSCAWAVPDVFTEHNYPCYEGGENCVTK